MRKLGIGDNKETSDAIKHTSSADAGEEGKDIPEDIPEEFTKVALAAGWTEQEIVDFASELDDAALFDAIKDLSEGTDGDMDDESATVKDKKSSEKQKEPDDTEKGTGKSTAKDSELAQLKKEIKELKDEISKSKESRQAQEEAELLHTVNQAFDEASKDFEIFGKTEELLKYPAGPKKGQIVPSSPAMVARAEVFEKAAALMDADYSTEEAMDIALTWYKGKHLESNVQRNVIRDLKKHERKLSAKRSGKETTKTYESEEEREADVVREAARKAGIRDEYFDS